MGGGSATDTPRGTSVTALTLLIIRHAEKPGGDWPGAGLTDAGLPDSESLVVRGWQRAGAWATLFGNGRGGDDYPTPAAIYAASPTVGEGSDTSSDDASQRPFETITPLGLRLGLTPVTKWAQGDEAQLIAEITGLAGVVLVCWEHKRIVGSILPAITSDPGLNLPQKWKGSRFDVVLRFDRPAPGKPWAFRPLYPLLLSGDSNQPVDS